MNQSQACLVNQVGRRAANKRVRNRLAQHKVLEVIIKSVVNKSKGNIRRHKIKRLAARLLHKQEYQMISYNSIPQEKASRLKRKTHSHCLIK